MTRRSFRLGLRLGLLAGVLIVVAKLLQSRRTSRDDAWPPSGSGAGAWPPIQADPVAPEPPVVTVPDRIPPVKKATSKRASPAKPASRAGAGPAATIPPMAPSAPVTKRVRKPGTRRARAPKAWVAGSDGACPASHPVKAKLASMLYHLPGMAAYNRTHPDRCYADADSAEADGFIRAKR